MTNQQTTKSETERAGSGSRIHELFAYLCVNNANDAIAFYAKAFGAREKFRLTEPSGRIGHAELDFGGTTVMLADEFPEYGFKGPQAIGGTPVTIHLHVDNADEVIDRAVKAGAKMEREIKDEFYGERSGCIRDPFGHRWNIGHSIEEVTPAEMQRRYNEAMNSK
ncbi:MAG: VOC family protein [Bryobacteraceae bacterium]